MRNDVCHKVRQPWVARAERGGGTLHADPRWTAVRRLRGLAPALLAAVVVTLSISPAGAQSAGGLPQVPTTGGIDDLRGDPTVDLDLEAAPATDPLGAGTDETFDTRLRRPTGETDEAVGAPMPTFDTPTRPGGVDTSLVPESAAAARRAARNAAASPFNRDGGLPVDPLDGFDDLDPTATAGAAPGEEGRDGLDATADGALADGGTTGLENVVPAAPVDGLLSVQRAQALNRAPRDGDLSGDLAFPVPRPSLDGFGAPLTSAGTLPRLDTGRGLAPDGRDASGPLAGLRGAIRGNPAPGPSVGGFAQSVPGTVESVPTLATTQPTLDGRDVRNGGRDDSAPYQPLGVRVGAFIVRPELQADVRATDNVRASAGATDSDVALEVRPTVRVESDWRRHALEAEVQGLASFHERFSSEDDRTLTALLRGRLDIRETTTLTGEATYDFRQESRSAVEGGTPVGDERPDLETFTLSIALDHRFGDLDARLRASAIRFDDALVDDGAAIVGGAPLDDGLVDAGDERDYIEYVGEAALSYRLHPGMALTARAERRDRDYASPVFADGLSRDTTLHEVNVGFVGDIRRGTVTGAASIGYGHLETDDGALPDLDGVIFDAALAWTPSALTTWRLTAAGDIQPTTLTGASGSLTQAFGLEVEHSFRRHLIGAAGLAFGTQDFAGVALTEDQLDAFISAEYLLSREWALLARYDFTDFSSTADDRDYQENALRVGLRARR